MLYNVMLIGDSLDKNCPNHWYHASHPPILKLHPHIEDKYLSPLLEWLRHLVDTNIDFRKFVGNHRLPFEKPQLC